MQHAVIARISADAIGACTAVAGEYVGMQQVGCRQATMLRGADAARNL
jgi:hypothetical protein